MKWKKIQLCENQKEQYFFLPSESEIANNEWGMGGRTCKHKVLYKVEDVCRHNTTMEQQKKTAH